MADEGQGSMTEVEIACPSCGSRDVLKLSTVHDPFALTLGHSKATSAGKDRASELRRFMRSAQSSLKPSPVMAAGLLLALVAVVVMPAVGLAVVFLTVLWYWADRDARKRDTQKWKCLFYCYNCQKVFDRKTRRCVAVGSIKQLWDV